ncbi:protein ATP6V1FNB-like [Uloborus diversus]|uniref:protein ATP6V1FNB-like n=1 Tax=Uloborus diversus TaxID=327109 RepID=UPI00240A7129|nr:protein ATP6V1FNB-like [Uloborus diversus]
MARDKMFDPAFQKAFTEAILKEKQTRMKWHQQYGKVFDKSKAVDWDEDPDEACESLPEDRPCLYEPHDGPKLPSAEDRAWPASTAPISDTIPRIAQPPVVMKPVSAKSRKYLYQGLSHDGEGRAQYLQNRYQDSPEKRYYYPICSSWEYGWTYGQNQDLSCPKHGRRNG